MASPDEVIAEMMALQKSLPPRPSPQQLEAAITEVDKSDISLASCLDELCKRRTPEGVLPAVFDSLQEMRKDVVEELFRQQKSAAALAIKLEERHQHYETLIQNACSALSSFSHSSPKNIGPNKYTASYISQKEVTLSCTIQQEAIATISTERELKDLTSGSSATSVVKLKRLVRSASSGMSGYTSIAAQSSSSGGGKSNAGPQCWHLQLAQL